MRSSQAWFAKIKSLVREGKLKISYNWNLLIHYNPRDEGFTERVVCYCTGPVTCSCYHIALAYVNKWYNENIFDMQLDTVDPQKKIWTFSARY